LTGVAEPRQSITMANGNFIRTTRQLTLFTIMVMIAGGSYLTRARSTSWEEPLWVSVYPIAADNRAATHDYIDGLTGKNFAAIEQFMETETARYSVNIDRPFRIDVGDAIEDLPPAPPVTRNPLYIAWWSLQLRWWSHRVTQNQPGPPPNIRLFLVYHDPTVRQSVPHSLGLQKGMLGVVHVFADRSIQGENNFVIAHEILHTLGATDKYLAENNLPIFPSGYADPDREPLYPQKYAEIMGGRIPRSQSEAVMPHNLKEARVGPGTAAEIRWTS